LVEAVDAAGDVGKRILEGGGGSDPDRVCHRPVQGGHRALAPCALQAFMCLVAHRHDEVPFPDDVSDLARAGLAQIEVMATPDRDCTLVDTISGIGAG
jgi:hypothetical protein